MFLEVSMAKPLNNDDPAGTCMNILYMFWSNSLLKKWFVDRVNNENLTHQIYYPLNNYLIIHVLSPCNFVRWIFVP